MIITDFNGDNCTQTGCDGTQKLLIDNKECKTLVCIVCGCITDRYHVDCGDDNGSLILG